MKKVAIREGYVGLLYEDGAFARVLQPGKHECAKGFFDRTARNVVYVDVRQRSLTIKGQEILTNDKVAIRVSLLVYFRVRDPQAAIHNVSSYEERIYEDVQLAARRFLASRTLEAILSDRNEISDTVRDDVRGTAESYGVEILRADVKDLVFPGNLRQIMNQVLETERRAEAKLIEARKQAETLRVQSEAENEAEMRKLEAKRERDRLTAEAERERNSIQLQSAIENARALQENPGLFKLRQLEVLKEMARSGARFAIGLGAKDVISLTDEEN